MYPAYATCWKAATRCRRVVPRFPLRRKWLVGAQRLPRWRSTARRRIRLPALLLWRRKRERVPDNAYLLVYHYVSYAPTWLLSGPRYTSAAYALYPMLARIPRRKWQFAVMLLIECALLAFMTVVGLWRMKVY